MSGKTSIIFKDKFFWEMRKNSISKEISWVLELNGFRIELHKIVDSNEWVIDSETCDRFHGVFDYQLGFTDDVKAKKYVEDKLLKWIKSIISIRI